MLQQISQLFHTIQPCLLCQQYPAEQHGACSLCWQELAWLNHSVKRSEVICQVSLAYAFPIREIIHQYKNQQQQHYQHFLASCLITQQPFLPSTIQAIVPMPISDEKLITRGFDHIAALAQILSKIWHIPLWTPVARQESVQQRGLDRIERLNNLKGKFYLTTNHCTYKRVLMLDDVITTGASLSALAEPLYQLGCAEVTALCLCDAAHRT